MVLCWFYCSLRRDGSSSSSRFRTFWKKKHFDVTPAPKRMTKSKQKEEFSSFRREKPAENNDLHLITGSWGLFIYIYFFVLLKNV